MGSLATTAKVCASHPVHGRRCALRFCNAAAHAGCANVGRSGRHALLADRASRRQAAQWRRVSNGTPTGSSHTERIALAAERTEWPLRPCWRLRWCG